MTISRRASVSRQTALKVRRWYHEGEKLEHPISTSDSFEFFFLKTVINNRGYFPPAIIDYSRQQLEELRS